MAKLNITDALRTDIAHTGDMTRTPGGDLGTISGLNNLQRALFHRLVTVPGTLVHRPTYGVGIGRFQNAVASFAIQQRIAALIKDQFSQDPRVQSVGSVSIQTTDANPSTVVLKVFVTPVGYTEQALLFTPFSGGIT